MSAIEDLLSYVYCLFLQYFVFLLQTDVFIINTQSMVTLEDQQVLEKLVDILPEYLEVDTVSWEDHQA